MLSTAIISLILLVLVSVTSQTSSTWRYTTGKIEQFRESRAAFETITTKISQATLNTYWDYDSPTLPTRYERRSELRFISGQASQGADALLGNGSTESGGTSYRVTQCLFFHAPLGIADRADYKGLENLLNVWGYFVEFRDDKKLRPSFVTDATSPPKFRFRLMEFMQPSENLPTYLYTSGLDGSKPKSAGYVDKTWFKTAVNASSSPSRPVAENIIALILTPRLSKSDELAYNKANGGSSNPDISPLAPLYSFDSTKVKNSGVTVSDAKALKQINPKNQLPPVIQVTMVAIDEVSASRLRLDAGKSDIFKLSGKFTDTSKYTADLVVKPGAAADASLENTLIDKKVSYRFFTTNIPIRAAKWSREQVN